MVILLSPKTSNNAFVFPLWLISATKKDLFDEPATERRPNLAPDFLAAIREKLDYTPQPEAIFHYLYAVLHSPTYRSRYAEYLKSDFPRVPLPHDRALFERLVALGEKLVALHLLKAPELAKPGTGYPVDGSHAVEKISFDAANGRVYFNPTQYFTGVEQADWDFHIGGYRVLEKWLKDRKGRTLTIAEITHYQQVAAAIRATRGLMAEIDAVASGLWAS
jgi:predicted helicase